MERKLICIVCPNSCQLEVSYQGKEVEEVKGAICQRGEEFARSEISNPRRIFTGSVRVKGGELPLVSVKTAAPVPKKYLLKLGQLSHQIEVMAPVEVNQVLVADLFGEGVDLLATKRVKRFSR